MTKKKGIREEVQETVAAGKEALDKAAAEKEAKKEPKDAPFDWKQILLDFADNHQGDARRFVERFAGQFCYDNKLKRWFKFNCTKWAVDEARCVEKAVAEIAGDYERQAGWFTKQEKESSQAGERDAARDYGRKASDFAKRAFNLKDPARIDKVLKVASAGANSLGLSGDEWNRFPNLFVARNQIIDTEDGRVRPASSQDYLNMGSQVEWTGLHADASEWLKFLDDVLEENQELIDYVQQQVGYWLTGYTKLQDFPCLWGPRGRNGKGAFFRTIRKLLGDYYTTIPSEMLLSNKGLRNATGADPHLLDLRHRRLAVASESSKHSKFSDDAIKNLTGGDPIKVRGLYSDPIEYLPEFKLLFATNRIPTVDGADNAFKERLRIIRFNRQYSSQCTEPDLEKKLFPMDPYLEDRLGTPESLSGILAWAVRGAIKLHRNNFILPVPLCVRDETYDYMADMDPIGEFISQCLIITDATERDAPRDKKTQAKDIYDVYVAWCKDEKRMNEKFIPSLQVWGADFKVRPEIRRVPPKNYQVYNVIVNQEWRYAQKGTGESGDGVPF